MRRSVLVLIALASLASGCGQPTLLSCPDGEVACDDGCAASCQTITAACAIDNGGCSADASCADVGGSAVCTCEPGFTGTGIDCAMCSMCAGAEFLAAPCTPTADSVCTACSTTCPLGSFEVQPCGPFSDRVCTACATCATNQYEIAACSGVQDTLCGTCEVGCATCTGPGAACTSCELGYFAEGPVCIMIPPPVCANGVLEGGEMCDDGNMAAGDGCSDQCAVEADHYCFGATPSFCRPGGCAFEPATALPLGAGFALDGAGTASAAGLQFSQRSSIHTTMDLQYPVLIEATLVYSAVDLTFVGTRGTGLRDPMDADEPTESVRARLGATVELATGPDVTVISSTTGFTPTPGVPYTVRYMDDGFVASIEWRNTVNQSESVAIAMPSSFHGGADRAFIGGGDMAGLTVSDVRVCSAPLLPVTNGLVARYTAIPSWTVLRSGLDIVSRWEDLSGNANHLDTGATSPMFSGGLINAKGALDFSGGAQLLTTAFPLTTDVTVFAVITHRTPGQWGAIAHHGSRDNDWSMEQSGFNGSNVVHFQTSNDNANADLTLVQDTSYVMAGRFAGNARYFSATAFVGTSPTAVDIVDASHSITAGSKVMYVGTSDATEASNAFIGELVYYNRALSNADRDAVINYLHGQWRP